MTFILVSTEGKDIQVNAWNWRPTLELLFAEQLITEEQLIRLGAHGCGGEVDAATATRIAEVIADKLATMNRCDRLLGNLSVTDAPKQLATFDPNCKQDTNVNEIYSTSYQWLETFAEFCRKSNGFEVL